MDNGHVRSPHADSLAAPINHGGKVNSKDIVMHAQQPINLPRSILLQLITSVFLSYSCLLLMLNLITAYLDSPIDSPNGTPGDVDNVKMDEWRLP